MQAVLPYDHLRWPPWLSSSHAGLTVNSLELHSTLPSTPGGFRATLLHQAPWQNVGHASPALVAAVLGSVYTTCHHGY